MDRLEHLRPGLMVEGRYALEALEGTDAFGEIWRARRGDHSVAVRFFPEGAGTCEAALFERETEALMRLRDDHLARVIAHGAWAQRRLLVTEHVEGVTLRARLDASGGSSTLATVRAILDQLCAGVGAAHVARRSPIVHGALRPERVVLAEGGSGLRVVVLDVGVTRLVAHPWRRLRDEPGVAAYLSSEQTREEPVLPATDVYALGVMLLELLTGATTRDPASWARLPPTGLRTDVPTAVWEVISEALQPQARDRFPDARALRQTLERAWSRGTAPLPPKQDSKTSPQLPIVAAIGVLGVIRWTLFASSPQPAPAHLAPPPPLPPGLIAAPAEVEASHVQVMWHELSGAPSTITRTREEARALAEEVLRRARDGEDFGTLARSFSDEPGAGTRSGALGRFQRSLTLRPFEYAAFALRPGELSGVVETALGFHVIKRTR